MIAATFLERLVDWLTPLFATFGYAVIAVAVLLERSIFIGLIVPGDVVLILGGLYAQRGELAIGWVIALGAIAAIAGESVGYALGRRFGMGLIARLPLGSKVEGRLEEARAHFARKGGATVALGRWATAAGAFMPFIAGTAHMPYRRFLAYDVPAIVAWASVISLLGYFFGTELHLIERALSRFGWVALGVLVVVLGLRWMWARRARKSKAD